MFLTDWERHRKVRFGNLKARVVEGVRRILTRISVAYRLIGAQGVSFKAVLEISKREGGQSQCPTKNECPNKASKYIQ